MKNLITEVNDFLDSNNKTEKIKTFKGLSEKEIQDSYQKYIALSEAYNRKREIVFPKWYKDFLQFTNGLSFRNVFDVFSPLNFNLIPGNYAMSISYGFSAGTKYKPTLFVIGRHGYDGSYIVADGEKESSAKIFLARGNTTEFVAEWENFEDFVKEELWRLAKLSVQDEKLMNKSATMWVVAHGEKYLSFEERLKERKALQKAMMKYTPQFLCDKKVMAEIDKLIKRIIKLDIDINFPHDKISFKPDIELFLPDSYKYFLDRTDGISFDVCEIFSSKGLNEIENMQEYLDAYGKGYKKGDWIFFADDGMGGYYAFKNNKTDQKVYYFDHEFPEKLRTFVSFEKWLKTQIKGCD